MPVGGDPFPTPPVSPRTSHAAAELERIFTEAATARHIAEKLETCKASDRLREAVARMAASGYDVLGVTDGASVVGYVERGEGHDGPVSSRLREFHPSELIPDSAPLVDLLERLVAAPRAFVLSREGVTGIATRGDLQKAPVRAYLFGLITALEMTLTQRIRDSHKEPVWTRWLSSGRIEKARELLKLRRSRNEEIDLLECLQLADKRTLALRSPSVRPQLPFDRKTAALEWFKSVEKLRDRLAHGQDLIVGSSWDELVRTVRTMRVVLGQLEPRLKG